MPQWTDGSRNKYVIIDEIAYIGECTPTMPPSTSPSTPSTESPTTTRAFPRRKTSSARPSSQEVEEEVEEDEEEPEDSDSNGEEKEETPTIEPLTKAVSLKKTTRIYPALAAMTLQEFV